MAEAILSSIGAGELDSMSCTLWGAAPQCTVTAEGASTPTLAAYPPQGDLSRFSATQ